SSKREGGPAMPGASGDGTSNMTIEAKWLGACQADQKPGDMILANGRKLNINDMPNLQQSLERIKGLQGLTGARPPAPKYQRPRRGAIQRPRRTPGGSRQSLAARSRPLWENSQMCPSRSLAR